MVGQRATTAEELQTTVVPSSPPWRPSGIWPFPLMAGCSTLQYLGKGCSSWNCGSNEIRLSTPQ